MKTVCVGAIYTIGTKSGYPNSPILCMAKVIEAATNGSIVFVGGTATDALPALAELENSYPRFDFSHMKERIEKSPALYPNKPLEEQFYALGAIGYLSPSLEEVLEATVKGADLLCIDFWCEQEWVRTLRELKSSTGCRIIWNISWARTAVDIAAAADCADILVLPEREADKLNACTSIAREKILVLYEETEDAYLQVGLHLKALTRGQG